MNINWRMLKSSQIYSFQALKQDVHRHEGDVSRLGDLENELETDSSQVSDQVKDVRKRYDTVRNNIDAIVDELESAHADQTSYRDMLQVSTYFHVNYHPQRSWGKVIFSQASVILLTRGGLPQCMLG